MADREAFRFIWAQWWSYTFPCFHAITIFSRDLTSDWLRSAATFSFGCTVVCFHATICAHTLDTALRSICLFFSLSDPIFLTYPAFNSDVNQILEGIIYYIVSFRYHMLMHLFISRASTIAFVHTRSLAFTQTRYRKHESNESTKYQNKTADLSWILHLHVYFASEYTLLMDIINCHVLKCLFYVVKFNTRKERFWNPI